MHAKKLGFALAIVVFLLLNAIGYQNCSSPTSFQNSGQSLSLGAGNGWAYDGIIYRSTSTCVDGSAKLQISALRDGRIVLIRQNCVDLAPPRVLAATEFQYNPNQPDSIGFEGESLNVESPVVAKYASAYLCNPPSEPVAIFSRLANGKGIMTKDGCGSLLPSPQGVQASEIAFAPTTPDEILVDGRQFFAISIPLNAVTSGRISVSPVIDIPNLLSGQSQRVRVTITADQSGIVQTLLRLLDQNVAAEAPYSKLDILKSELVSAGVPKALIREFTPSLPAGQYYVNFGLYAQDWGLYVPVGTISWLDGQYPSFGSFFIK